MFFNSQYFVLFLLFYFLPTSTVTSVRVKTSLHNQLQLTQRSGVKSTSQSKFIDNLLLDKEGSNASLNAGLYPPPQLPTSQYQVEEPPSLSQPEYPESQNLQASSPQSASEPSGKETPEAIISSALNNQKNAMEQFNKQLGVLTHQVLQWKQLEEEEVQKPHEPKESASSSQNQIQLTIRYPGTGVNETENILQEEKLKEDVKQKKEMLELAGSAANVTDVDPTKLRVPVFIIAPQPSGNYKKLVESMIKDSLTPGSEMQKVTKLKTQFLRSPQEQEQFARNSMKAALANVAFFQKDLNISRQRFKFLHNAT